MSHDDHNSHPDPDAKLAKNHAGGGGQQQDDDSDVILPIDTIILVCSLFVMVCIGLIFHRIITYLIALRNQRQMYEGGLKTLGDNMQVLATSMSNKHEEVHFAAGAHIPLKPIPSIRLTKEWLEDEEDKSRSIAVAIVPKNDHELFKPKTSCMLRNSSNPGYLQTTTQFYCEKQNSNN